MIVGGPGSGKSTLARALGERTGLPVFHMDHIHYASGWVERTKAEKGALTREVHARDAWIFEGGHSATYAERAARADTLVWLDVPVGRRLVRVIRRTLRYRGTTRPDLPDGCPERLNLRTLEFLWFVLSTRRRSRAKLGRLCDEARPELRVVRLSDDATVAAFLASVPVADGAAGDDGAPPVADRHAGGTVSSMDRSDDVRSRIETVHDPAAGELDAIYRLGRDVWGSGMEEGDYLEACRGSPKYRRGTWHVAKEGGRVVSALIVYAHGFGLAEGWHGIGSIATARDARGVGRASRLLDGVLEELDRSGSRGVFLFPDIETSLYARLGFAPAGHAGEARCLRRSFGTNEEPPSPPDYF